MEEEQCNDNSIKKIIVRERKKMVRVPLKRGGDATLCGEGWGEGDELRQVWEKRERERGGGGGRLVEERLCIHTLVLPACLSLSLSISISLFCIFKG